MWLICSNKKLYKKNNLFAAVTLHNNLLCVIHSYHLHCTNRPFIYVLRKDICLHSLADQNAHRLENCSQRNITQKQLEPHYVTEVLRWELTIVTSINYLFRDLVDNSAFFALGLIHSRS